MSVLLGAGLMSLLAAAPAPQQVPTFGADARAVEVDVLVTRDGRSVPGLTAADFELLDDGVARPVEVAAGPGAPVNAILVLDTSGSVAGERMASLKAAAGALLDALGPGDHATLITFADQSRLAAPATTDVGVLRAALAAATPGGATALHDALFAALQIADRRHGRPVLMVFSDGEDRLSLLGAGEVRAAARESDVVVYSAGLTTTVNDTGGAVYQPDSRSNSSQTAASMRGDYGRDSRVVPMKHREFTLLDELADTTGGRVWTADNGEQLKQAFLGVIEEVRGRYLLRFEPAGPAKGWHKLEVKLRSKDKVRARHGYHDGAVAGAAR